MRHGQLEIQEVKFNDETFQVTAPNPSKLRVSSTTVDTTYVLDRADMLNKFKIISHSAPVTLLVPSDTDQPCPIGTSITVCNYGTSDITVGAAPGAVINTPQSLKITGEFSQAILIKTEPNTWEIDGNIAGSNQVFIFPINPRFVTKVLNKVEFDPPIATDIVRHSISIIENGSAIYDEASIPAKNNGVIWEGPSVEDDSWTFTNSNVNGLYLKATVLTPGKTLNTTPDGLDIFRAEGEWALYTTPNSGNGWADYHTNPQWKIESPVSQEIRVTLRIDVSSTASDLDIIGHFFITVDPLLYDNFIFHQITSVSNHFIYMNTYGELFKVDVPPSDLSPGTKFGSVTLHPEYQRQIDPYQTSGIYYRVLGAGTHSGGGEIGTIYSIETNYGVYFGKPTPLSTNDTWTLEIMTDTTGVLLPLCSVDITFEF